MDFCTILQTQAHMHTKTNKKGDFMRTFSSSASGNSGLSGEAEDSVGTYRVEDAGTVNRALNQVGNAAFSVRIKHNAEKAW